MTDPLKMFWYQEMDINQWITHKPAPPAVGWYGVIIDLLFAGDMWNRRIMISSNQPTVLTTKVWITEEEWSLLKMQRIIVSAKVFQDAFVALFEICIAITWFINHQRVTNITIRHDPYHVICHVICNAMQYARYMSKTLAGTIVAHTP